jgi:hypothetical protein
VASSSTVQMEAAGSSRTLVNFNFMALQPATLIFWSQVNLDRSSPNLYQGYASIHTRGSTFRLFYMKVLVLNTLKYIIYIPAACLKYFHTLWHYTILIAISLYFLSPLTYIWSKQLQDTKRDIFLSLS